MFELTKNSPVLQTKNSMRSVSAINPVATENTGKIPTQPQGSCIALSRIDALHCQQKNWRTKASVLYILRLEKRHILG